MSAAAIDLAAADTDDEVRDEMGLLPEDAARASRGLRIAFLDGEPPTHPASRAAVTAAIPELSRNLLRARDRFDPDLGTLLSVGQNSTCGRLRALIE